MADTKQEARGTAWLAEYINDSAGTDYDQYGVRILLRRLAKDEVIVREDGRYAFTGPNDPTVKAVLKYVKSGGAEKANKERLDELKAKRTTKKASAAKAAPVEEEDEEEEETPARKARARGRTATKKTAATATAPARKRTRKAPVEEVEEDDEDLDIDEI